MYKYKLTYNNLFIKKKILFYIILFYGLNSFAMNPLFQNSNTEQYSNYLNNLIDDFLSLKEKSSAVNNIFSPAGMHASFISLQHILNNKSTTRLEHNLHTKGISTETVPFSVDNEILHFFTVVITTENILEEARNKLNDLNIPLIENIDVEDKNNLNTQLENNKPKLKCKKIFIHRFIKKQQSSPSTSNCLHKTHTDFLKINSVVNFQNNLQLGGFQAIGTRSFITSDNQQIEIDFIEKVFYKAIEVQHKTSKWKAIRLSCSVKYSIDLILPDKKKQYQNTTIKQILFELINSLNHNYFRINNEKTVMLQMPKFEFKQKNNLTILSIKNYFSGIFFDYRNFLVNNTHNFSPLITQESYVKLDADDSKTIKNNKNADIASLPTYEEVIVDKPYFFVISEFEPYKKYKNIYTFKNIIMIGEVGDPSQ